MIIYVKTKQKQKEPTGKLLELINEFDQVAGYQINI